jgi:hypothetical protein
MTGETGALRAVRSPGISRPRCLSEPGSPGTVGRADPAHVPPLLERLVARRSRCGFSPGAVRQQGQELFRVAGQLHICESGDEVPQRYGLIE